MYIVILGAGAVGANLARDFSRNGHDVAIIEKNSEICSALALDFDGLIIQGDGTHVDVLTDAGIRKADCFAAVTGCDKENMIACGLVKRHFNCARTIGRVNDPANETVFPTMGVDFPVSATRIIAKAIENESELVKEMTVLTMKDGEMKLIKFKVEADCPIKDKALRDLVMPRDARISIVEHAHTICIPQGDTVISEGDHAYVILKSHAEAATRELFIGNAKKTQRKRS